MTNQKQKIGGAAAEKPRRQCKKCPWRKATNPHEIPDGYCVIKHRALKSTIAQPGEIRIGGDLQIMACHHSMPGQEIPCVGWLANQIGPGNNIVLRIAAMRKQIDANVVTVGEQHVRFEDTLPRKKRL